MVQEWLRLLVVHLRPPVPEEPKGFILGGLREGRDHLNKGPLFLGYREYGTSPPPGCPLPVQAAEWAAPPSSPSRALPNGSEILSCEGVMNTTSATSSTSWSPEPPSTTSSTPGGRVMPSGPHLRPGGLGQCRQARSSPRSWTPRSPKVSMSGDKPDQDRLLLGGLERRRLVSRLKRKEGVVITVGGSHPQPPLAGPWGHQQCSSLRTRWGVFVAGGASARHTASPC